MAKSVAKQEYADAKPNSRSGKQVKVSLKKDNEKGNAASSTETPKKAPKQ